MSEMSLSHIRNRFSWYVCVISTRSSTSTATLEFPEVTLVMLYFHFVLTRKLKPACPLLASEWYSRWPLWRVTLFRNSTPKNVQ